MSNAMPQRFLDYIVANIDEDTARLAYADWLLENGDDDRAEFIRVQIDRARLPEWDGAQVRLRLREQQLLKKYGEKWLAELPIIEGAKWEGFRRGVVAEVSFASFEAMRANAHNCRAVAPVEAATVRWPRRGEPQQESPPIAELRELFLTGRPDDQEEIGWLADSPQLSTLRSLTARGLWVEGLRRLVASPHLGGLKSLRLPSNNLGNAGILALVDAASLSALEALELTGRGVSEQYRNDQVIRSPGMDALAAWSGLATVRTLSLPGNDIGATGLRSLLRSPRVGALKELFLRNCRLNGQAMAEFNSAAPALRLETVDLGENILRDLGAEYAAIVPCFSELKALRLDRCEITSAGARVFTKKATFLSGLRQLDLAYNHLGSTGLGFLLAAKPSALHTLHMRDNDLLNQGAELLASSPASNTLLEVDLSQNSLGPQAARALGDSAHLRELLTLRLLDNSIDSVSGAALAASPLGKRLAVLELQDAPDPSLPGEEIPF